MNPAPKSPTRSSTAVPGISTLVTPRGRTVQVRAFAGFWRRAAALLLDEAITFFPGNWVGSGLAWLVVTLFLGDSATPTLTQGQELALSIVADLLITVPYQVAFLYFWGYTPGKWAMRVIVRDAKTAERLRLSQCFYRYVAEIVSLIPMGWGYVMVARDPEKRGLHDLIAGTVCYTFSEKSLTAMTDPTPNPAAAD